MLRRQCGVPAFSSNPALASSGTTHCTRLPKVARASGWCTSASETIRYTLTMDSQTPTRMPIVREEDILLLAAILEGKRRHRFPPTYSFGVTITENNRRDRNAKSPRPHGHYLTVLVASLWAGGGGGIRTPETLSSLTVFKTAGFNRSPTPPIVIITGNSTYRGYGGDELAQFPRFWLNTQKCLVN